MGSLHPIEDDWSIIEKNSVKDKKSQAYLDEDFIVVNEEFNEVITSNSVRIDGSHDIEVLDKDSLS